MSVRGRVVYGRSNIQAYRRYLFICARCPACRKASTYTHAQPVERFDARCDCGQAFTVDVDPKDLEPLLGAT